MALTESTMMPLGTLAPDFSLKDPLTGKVFLRDEFAGPYGFVVIFMCNHCPYVKHILPQLVIMAREYTALGLKFVAINSNDVENYPLDHPQHMAILAKEMEFTFPFLFDETQQVAKDYQAACTPDFYLFNREMNCLYRGQFDDSRPGSVVPVTGNSLRKALDLALKGLKIEEAEQRPSIGCNIKWKKEP